MKIAICTIDTPELWQFAPATAASKVEYAARWDVAFFRIPFSITDRPVSWGKIALTRQVLQTYDWVWWLDADAGITNHTIDPKTLIADADFIVAKDVNGINCGSFLMRAGEVTNRFIDRVWSRTEFLNHHWWEQAAIIAELERDPAQIKVHHPPKAMLNAYPDDWMPDSVVIHYPGSFSPRRCELTYKMRNAKR